MARLLAVDPGPTKTAIVVLDDKIVIDHGKYENADALRQVREFAGFGFGPVVIEMIASYGKPVGQETFETCVWVGRFMEASNGTSDRMFRKEVTKHICGSCHKINDAIVRQRMIDIYSNGQGELVAVGRKKSPGPLYGISADQWQALALGVAFGEIKLGWKIQQF